MSITVSFEMAKRLKEAGWEKTPLLMWWIPLDPETGPGPPVIDFWDPTEPTQLPAPTFAEIWEELPKTIEFEGKTSLKVLESFFGVAYAQTRGGDVSLYWSQANITEAAADAWVNLKERRII